MQKVDMKIKKENKLLYLGTAIFCCTLLVYYTLLIYKIDVPFNNDKFNGFNNFLTIAFSTLIIAPILEELIFRGIFVNEKRYKLFFYIGSVGFCLFTSNYYLIIIPLFLFVNKFKNKNNNYFLATVLFALVHYSLHDFKNIISIIPAFFQFSLGLILLWIAINYGLKKSILAHFLINLSVIFPLFLVLQFPNTDKNSIKNDIIVFEWQKTPTIGNTNFVFTPKEITANRLSISDFINIYGDSKENYPINDTLMYYKFNFKIQSSENLDRQAIIQTLYKAKLIESTRPN